MTAEEKEHKLTARLKAMMPAAQFLPYRYYPEEEALPTAVYLTSFKKNSALCKTPYHFKENKLIHFTTLEAAESIITNKNLRLYNLEKLNDPREFGFAATIFYDNAALFEHSRRHLFSASFCNEKILKKENKTDQFNLWRLYGNNGKGASIVFSVVNASDLWEDHFLSPIRYGKNKKGVSDGFIRLYKLLKTLNASPPAIGVDFGNLFCFHKSLLYAHEQEVRMVFDGREMKTGAGYTRYSFDGKQLYPVIVSDENSNIKYLELPLTPVPYLPMDKIPQLRIESVFIGHALSVKEFGEAGRKLTNLFKNNFEYLPAIKRSNLAFEYWGK